MIDCGNWLKRPYLVTYWVTGHVYLSDWKKAAFVFFSSITAVSKFFFCCNLFCFVSSSLPLTLHVCISNATLQIIFNSVNKWLHFPPNKAVTFTSRWLYSSEILLSGNSGTVCDLFQHPAQAQACCCFEKSPLWRLQELGVQIFPLFPTFVRKGGIYSRWQGKTAKA